MGLFYANLIITGHDGLGNPVDYSKVIDVIEKKITDPDKLNSLKEEIKTILINKGYAQLIG